MLNSKTNFQNFGLSTFSLLHPPSPPPLSISLSHPPSTGCLIFSIGKGKFLTQKLLVHVSKLENIRVKHQFNILPWIDMFFFIKLGLELKHFYITNQGWIWEIL